MPSATRSRIGPNGSNASTKQALGLEQPDFDPFGHIASMPEAYLNGHTSFVVMLEGGTPTAITCSTGRQGSRWDYASEAGASP